MRGKAARFMIERQIVRQYPDRLEAIANLEADHRIALLAFENKLEIILGRADGIPAPRQIRHAAGKYDALQPQVLAQFLSFVVEPLTDAPPAKFGIDADVHAVDPIAGRIVPRGVAAAGNRRPVVRLERQRFRNQEGGAIPDDAVFIGGDELALRKLMHLTEQLRFGIDAMRPQRRIGLGHDRADALDIGGHGVANDEFWRRLRFWLHIFRYGSVSLVIATVNGRAAIGAALPPGATQTPGGRAGENRECFDVSRRCAAS